MLREIFTVIQHDWQHKKMASDEAFIACRDVIGETESVIA